MNRDKLNKLFEYLRRKKLEGKFYLSKELLKYLRDAAAKDAEYQVFVEFVAFLSRRAENEAITADPDLEELFGK